MRHNKICNITIIVWHEYSLKNSLRTYVPHKHNSTVDNFTANFKKQFHVLYSSHVKSLIIHRNKRRNPLQTSFPHLYLGVLHLYSVLPTTALVLWIRSFSLCTNETKDWLFPHQQIHVFLMHRCNIIRNVISSLHITLRGVLLWYFFIDYIMCYVKACYCVLCVTAMEQVTLLFFLTPNFQYGFVLPIAVVFLGTNSKRLARHFCPYKLKR
jgi:hypothetical protein